MIVLAHGVGSRADLPVPLTLALYGAGLAVLVSFLALVLLWRTPRLRGDAAGRPLPGVVQAVVDSPVTKGVLRAVVLLLTLVVVAVALVGPPSRPAPGAGAHRYRGSVPPTLDGSPAMTRTKHLRSITGRKLAAGALSVPMALTMVGTAAASEPVAAESTVIASTADELLAHDALAAKPAGLPAQATKAETVVEGPETDTVGAAEVVTVAEPARPAPAAPAAQGDSVAADVMSNGTTCDKLGYTKLDSSRGTETVEFGTLVWGGDTLIYTVQDGYTVDLCIKGGNEAPLVELRGETDGDTYTHPQAISHIGYRIVAAPEDTPPVVTPPVVTPPVDEDEDTDIGGGGGGAGTGTPPVVTPPGNGGTPVVETPVVSTPVVPVLPIGGKSAAAAGSGVVNTGAAAPQAFAPTFGAGVSTASPSALPYTGSTTSLLLALGAGLVVVGGGLALSGRRETLAPTA